jgi:hypothetical protein
MIRAFQWDLARQVERLDVLLQLLQLYSRLGYSELYLHLEDAVEYPSLPTIARADAYSYKQLEQLVSAASAVGIGVVPIVNLLGHTQYLIKDPAYRDLNELRAEDGSPLATGQICPNHPRTREVADRLLHDMRPFCTAGKVHVGLDESFHLGKCPRCRAEIASDGLATHFARHVHRLHNLTQKHQLRLGMWADMLNFIPDAIDQLPTGIAAYDWYYYPFQRTPAVELFNFRKVNLAPALKRRGIEYWGCPMNGAFRYEPIPLFRDRLENIRSWWKRCQRVKAAGMLITSWEAYRLALETTTVIDAAAAELWLNPSNSSPSGMLATGFRRVFGLSARAAENHAEIGLACDKYPFAGYARWEVNDRWDLRADPFDRFNHGREERGLSKLAKRAERLAEPMAASVAFRHYLARRDNFVEEAARGVFKLRAAFASGRIKRFHELLAALRADAEALERAIPAAEEAIQKMWDRTRDRRRRGQNAVILERDRKRLTKWQRWLSTCSANPSKIKRRTPMCGAWQLTFWVDNHWPALQRVSVEQQATDGSWTELHGRYTIEFQAAAARRRTRINRLFSVPVSSADAPLRLVLKGLGRVAISGASLANGIRLHPLRLYGRHRCVIGNPAPTKGFPDIRQTQAVLNLARYRDLGNGEGS